MSDDQSPERSTTDPAAKSRGSTARRAGRGFWRAVRELLGDRGARKLSESAQVLAEQYRAGRAAAENEGDAQPRHVRHRILPDAGAGIDTDTDTGVDEEN